jgi:hypothetical protein
MEARWQKVYPLAYSGASRGSADYYRDELRSYGLDARTRTVRGMGDPKYMVAVQRIDFSHANGIINRLLSGR